MYLITDEEFKKLEETTDEAFVEPIRKRKVPIVLTKSQQSALDSMVNLIKLIGK